jgi:hypothetical protein
MFIKNPKEISKSQYDREKQLKKWGVKHTELRMNKPSYDFWIDDKAYNANTFFDELYF